ALADALKSNSTVTHVDLRYNEIGDEGDKALADAVESNRTVTVNLTGSQLGGKGAKALAAALKSNCTVTHVDLQGNNFGDEGVK
ncbi:NLRC3, partial [Symbiodinium microadriaticum]